MQHIGRVKLVQIQQKSLKQGQKPNRYFDPGGLLAVDHLRLTIDGVIGIADDGREHLDIHNATHPQTRNNGTNGISIGFTDHYDAMRGRFGSHLTDGSAGENIIIQSERGFTEHELAGGLVFQNPSTNQRIPCTYVKFMAPCKEFSQFCAMEELDGPILKDVLQFLGDGRRGFVIEPTVATPSVRPGDLVFLAE